MKNFYHRETETNSLNLAPETGSGYTDSDEEEPQAVSEKDLEEPRSTQAFPLFTVCQKASVRRPVLSKLIQKKISSTPWTEFQLLHELLWALRLGSNSSLKPTDELQSSVIQIRNQNGFSYDMKALYNLVERLMSVKSFLDELNLSDLHSLTYQAYIVSLHLIISEFYQTLVNFELIVSEQKSTVILSQLFLLLKPWKKNAIKVVELHETILKTSSTVMSNNTRVNCLLSVLFSSAQESQITSYTTFYPIVLRLLLSSLDPFLNAVDMWLSLGELKDPYGEFSFIRNDSISPQDEDFWLGSLAIRPMVYPTPTMDFLQPLLSDIVLGGRSVELLIHLNRFLNLSISPINSNNPTKLVDAFRDRLSSRFLAFIRQPTSDPNINALSCEPRAVDSQQLLTNAFKCVRAHLYQIEKHELDPTHLHSATIPTEFFPVIPLLEQSLFEPIRNRQRIVCKALLDTLYEKCSLRVHLLALRQIFFMQAGDLIGHFCQQLFKKLKTGDKWNNETSLTLSLLNCISTRMSQSTPFISVSFERRSSLQKNFELSGLLINYKVPWPINLIITQQSLTLYNKVFRFLLKIKHSLISLQRLSFKELNSMEYGDNSHSIQNKISSANSLRRRLQLLRAWLLHFVTCVDNYLMECVLESSHLQFDSQLKNVSHLGEVIESHQNYICSVHKQCLQEPSGSFLRDAIDEVLSISIEVCKAWINGILSDDLSELEESYIRHHQFVAAVLGTDASHSMLPYVETLAAALIYSCPTSNRHLEHITL